MTALQTLAFDCNLLRHYVKKGFEDCILTPELLANKVAGLRFKLGDSVECKTGEDDNDEGVWSKVGRCRFNRA